MLAGTGDVGLKVGYTTGSGVTDSSLVSLGMTNGVFCDYGIGIGLLRGGGSVGAIMSFNPVIATGGSAYFRNRAGTGPQSYWLIGDGNSGAYSGNVARGIVDFSLGTVDAQVGQLVVGRNQNNAGAPSSGAAGGQGTLTLKAGIVGVGTALMGYQNVDNGPAATGVINVDGTAQLIITNSLQLGRFMATNNPLNGISFAILNIGTNSGGGSVTVMGNISTVTNANNSLSYSEIRVRNGGSFSVKGPVGPLTTFELNGSSATVTQTFDFGVSPNPVSAVCVVSNLQTVAPITVNLRGGSSMTPGQFPLIQYQYLSGNGLSDFTTINWPTQIQGYLSNNVANSSIDLVITNAVLTLWTGQTNGVNVANWDIGTTPDWKHQDGTPTTYYQASVPGDGVIFDDSAPGTTAVDLTTVLSPVAMTFSNSTKAYSLTGSGQLAGPGGIYKHGSGTLSVANGSPNIFTGPIMLYEGGLQVSGGADRLPIGATVTLSDVAGATLDLNNNNQTLATISGGGATGGNIQLGSAMLTIAGTGGSFGGVISGTGKLVKTNTGTLTLAGANQYSGGTLVSSNTVVSVINTTGSGLGSGNIFIDGGILYIGSTSHGLGGAYGDVAAAAITNNLGFGTNLFTSYLYINRSDDYVLKAVLYGSGQMYLGDGPGRVIVEHANYQTNQTTSGYGPVRISHPQALGTSWMLVGGLAGAALELTNNITVNNTVGLNCKGGALLQPAHVINVSDTNTLAGPINFLSGGSDWVFRSDAGKLILRGPMSNLLGATRNYWLRGNGDGEVFGGFPVGVYVSPNQPTNNLTKDGFGTWTLWGANTYNGTTTINDGTLIINGSLVAGGTAGTSSTNVTVSGTLGGTGLITAPIYIYSTGTLSPGASSGAIGTLTVSNNLTFYPGSTAVFDVSAAGCDQVRGLKTVNYGGTLKVQLTGTLAGNAVFKLFDAASYSTASFDGFDLPTTLPVPLTWDTSYLTVDGTLRVVGQPTVSSFGLAPDGNFRMSGTGAADQPYRILANTNVTDPLSWIEAGNGTFTGGVFSFTDLGSTNYPRRFYRVVTP